MDAYEPAHAPAPAPAGGHRAEVQARLRQLQLKTLDIADGVFDRLMAKPDEPPAQPLVVARRQLVNLLGVPSLCARGRCRRTRLCQGQPAHCLTACLHVLPEEALARVLSLKAMRQRMRRR